MAGNLKIRLKGFEAKELSMKRKIAILMALLAVFALGSAVAQGQRRPCAQCNGSGVCSWCRGSGSLELRGRCTNCGGNGRCPTCMGTGRI